MKYTTHYQLNKPENSDQFNVEHFNENSTKIDNTLYSLDQAISPMSAHITDQNNPHNVTKSQVGLGNVDNTSDANKPISTATQAALNLKADSASLSNVATSGSYNDLSNKPTIPAATSQLTNDSGFISYKAVSTVANQGLSDTEKTNARTNIGAGTSNFDGAYSSLTGTPTLGSASSLNVARSGDASSSEVVKGDDSRLSDSRTPVAHTHTTSDVTDFPTLANVATSGSYNDLSNKPTIPTATSDLTNDSGFISYKAVSTVAGQGLSDTEKANARTNIGAGASSFSGDYNDLTNKPTLGTASALDAPASGNASTSQVVKGDDTRLTDSRTPTSHTHTASDLTNIQEQFYQSSEPSPNKTGAVWIG